MESWSKVTDQLRRDPVHGELHPRQASGTITWDEHLRVWDAYAAEYGDYPSAERIAERGGFSCREVQELLGHE